MGFLKGELLKANELKSKVADFSDTREHNIKQLRSCFSYEEKITTVLRCQFTSSPSLRSYPTMSELFKLYVLPARFYSGIYWK